MTHVLERNGQQLMDVLVVEGVVDVAPLAPVADEAIGAQQSQVVRAGGLREAGHRSKLAHAQLSALEQYGDESHPTRIREHAKGLGQGLEHALIRQAATEGLEPGGVRVTVVAFVERGWCRGGVGLAHTGKDTDVGDTFTDVKMLEAMG